MNIVIDTNVLIAALIRDGFIRKVLGDFRFNYLLPDFELEEIYNHKKEIMRKGGYSEVEFDIVLLRLLKYVRVIPADMLIDNRKEAKKIMDCIDGMMRCLFLLP